MAYQQFGSYGTFKQTPFPNRAQKILDEQKIRSQQQATYQEQQKQQQQSYLAVMRQKLMDERANRIRNFELENKQNAIYKEQLARNQQAVNRNTLQEKANAESIYKTLADFSFTAAEKVFEIGVEQKEKQRKEEYARAQLYVDGMSPDEFRNAMGGLQVMINSSRSQDAMINQQADIVESETSPQEAERIRKSANGGYPTILVKQALMSRASRNVAHFARLYPDVKIEVEDPASGELIELDLNQAEEKGGVYLTQYYREVVERTANQFREQGVDELFINKYFNQPAQKFISQRITQVEADRARQIKQNNETRKRDRITTEFDVGLSQGDTNSISDIVATQLGYGSPAVKRDNVLNTINTALEAGSFDDQLPYLLDHIKSQQITLGDGNVVPLESLAGRNTIYDSLISNIEERIKGQENEETSLLKSQAEELADLHVQAALDNDGRGDPNEIIALNKKAFEIRDQLGPEAFQAYRDRIAEYDLGAVDKLDKDTMFNTLREKAVEGDLTALELQQNISWLSDAQSKELQQFMIGTGAKPGEGYSRDDIESQVRKLFKKALGNESTDKIDHHSIDWAVSTAGSYYIERFETFIKDPNYTPESAAEQARKDTLDYVTAGVNDEKNPFYVVPSDQAKGTQAFFKNFASGFTAGQRTNPEQTYREIAADPSKLSTKVYLSYSYINDVRNDIKNGRAVTYTHWVNQIARQNNIKPYEVLNQQIKAAGGTEEIKPGSYDLLLDKSVDNPRLTNLLMQPTQARVNTSIISTNNAPSVVRSGVQGEQDVMQLAELAQFPSAPLAAAMWALETGRGKTVHGPNALFNIKSTDGSGTTTNTKEYLNGKWVNTSATWANYESPLQSAQALTKWAMKVPGYNEAKTPRQLLNAMYNAGYATDPNYVQKIESIFKSMGFNIDAPIIPYSGPKARDPNFMSPSLRAVSDIMYITGGEMAGDTPSYHLDLKQVDDPNTPQNELTTFWKEDKYDKYIEINDPEFGRIAPAELRKKYYKGGRHPGTDFYAHRNRYDAQGRRYDGTHYGWDYPTADGSEIRFKNGAYPISIRCTSYGAELVAQTPEGRFKATHGNCSTNKKLFY